MEIETQIVIGIPGRWANRDSLVMDVANKSNGLLLVGPALVEIETNEGSLLEVHEHYPDLAKSFEIAGRPRMAPADIQAIHSHTFTLYLTAKGGSLDQAQKVLNLGCGLLQAGGLAVIVENTGKAHTSQDWFALAAAKNETAIYHAFVTLVGGDNKYYSCGMHNLGLRDAIVTGDLAADDAARLLETFLLYVLIEKPALSNGHTFSETSDSQYYRVRAVPCDIYPDGHRFINPFGMWHLEPTECGTGAHTYLN